MSRTANQSVSPADLLHTLVKTRRTWGFAAVACTALAVVYALFMSRYWEATQGLVVRQEAAGAVGARPGKFNDLYEMRTFQETLLEVAKSRHVLEATVRVVDELGDDAEVNAATIDQLRRHIQMTPPGGAEFGKTEVFYLTAEDTDRDRAIRLVAELCNQVDSRLRELRQQRAEGMLAELAEQQAVTAAALDEQTKLLEEFEASVGPDLGELRMLHSAFGGQSDLREQLVSLERDLRTAETKINDGHQLIAQLRAAQSEPQRLVATPNSLLASQPALQRLKDGLVDAQLATARLRGVRSDIHPLVIAAVESESRIRKDLFGELGSAIHSAEAELELDESRRDDLARRLDNVRQRLSNLAEHRAEYSNRVAAVEQCRNLLEEARKQHSEAVAAASAAKTASLVTRIDKPQTGPYPAGPSRASVVLLGTIGGLGLGLGWVFLTLGPVVNNEGPAVHATRRRAAQPTADAPPKNADHPWWEEPAELVESDSLHGQPLAASGVE